MELLQGSFHVSSFDYGYKSVFALYSTSAQVKAADDLYDKIKEVEKQQEPVSILAHSLGSVIVVKCLEKYSDVRLDTLYLAGSVLYEGLDWARFTHSNRIRLVVNFASKDDWWVRCGGRLLVRRLGMGRAGALGFRLHNLSVVNRELKLFAHESVTSQRTIPELLTWAPGGQGRKTYDHLVRTRDALLRHSLLPLTFATAGSWEFIIPKLFVERNLRSWSGQAYDSLSSNYFAQKANHPGVHAPKTMVLGEAGQGKTTLLLREFLTGFETFSSTPDAAVPIWLQVPSLAESGDTSLFKAVQDRLDADWPECGTRQFVLLLDGIDEWPSSEIVREDFEHLSNKPTCVAIIVSSRKLFALGRYSESDIKEMFSDVLEIEPWSPDDAETFARGFIEQREAEESQRKAVQARFAKVYLELADRSPIMRSPLVLTMVLALICQNPEKEISARMSDIYGAIIELWVDRESSKTQSSSIVDRAEVIGRWKEIAWQLFQLSRSSSPTPHQTGLEMHLINQSDKVTASLLNYRHSPSGASVFGFLHETFLEYFVARSTIERLESWAQQPREENVEAILCYPVDEVLATFLKDLLACLDERRRVSLAARLGAAVTGFSLKETPTEEDVLFLNGLLYFLSRLDVREGVSALNRLWFSHGRFLSVHYPSAYVTLLSGASLNNLFDIEGAYLAAIVGDADSSGARTMVGWHLAYYGDIPTVGITRYTHTVVDPLPEKWAKSRTALIEKVDSSNGREIRLTLFHVCALWAIATHYRYRFPKEESATIRTALSRVAERFPKRSESCKLMLEALDPLL